MFFLNFTAGEFFLLFGAIAGLVTALYMMGRSKRKKVVSTLRFWQPSQSAYQQHNRSRMREPWSLLLQIASILLLLLAIGQPEWGQKERSVRKHVVLVDTSAWSSERVTGGTLLDEEKAMVERYWSRLGPNDRVLIVGVDALTTPVNLFTSNRSALKSALAKLQPSYSALEIGRALTYAQRVANLSGTPDDEVVYVGPGLVTGDAPALSTIPHLRIIRVEPDEGNCGIRAASFKRDERIPGTWNAAVTVRNYGGETRALNLRTTLAGQIVALRHLSLRPRGESTLKYSFAQKQSGSLVVQIDSNDVLTADNRVALELPVSSRIRTAVFTNRPAVLGALLRADQELDPTFLAPAEYRARPANADLIILDGIAPGKPPELPSLWIAPPQGAAPLPVRDRDAEDIVKSWNAETALGTGLQERETHVKNADVFVTGPEDIAVASTGKGPVVVASAANADHGKLAVIGFDPLETTARFQATVPLLFANLFRWLAPGFRDVASVQASFVGETMVPLERKESADGFNGNTDIGEHVPFAVRGRLLELFSDRPSAVKLHADGTGDVVVPVLADVAPVAWMPPKDSFTSGLPRAVIIPRAGYELWKWLAFIGGLGLLAEWILFGAHRRQRLRTVINSPHIAQKPELASK